MKIFIAYGYNPRDQWVKDLVIPILLAFRVEIETGESTYGGPIPQEVLRRIHACDALFAFTTRREQQGGQYWTTHHWVIQELAAALSAGLAVVEIRETGVDPQQGMQGNLQPIVYDEGSRDTCLVRIAQAIGNLRFSSFEVQLLLPDSDMGTVGPLARQGQVICYYRYKHGFYKSAESRTEVEAVKGGLFAVVKAVPPEALVKIRVEASGRTWTSNYESIGSIIKVQ